jgi:putative two-component system response regulator
MRVLIADDDTLALQMLQNAVARFGYEVDAVDNGNDAMDVLRRGETRMVISDWEMPGMNGLELCRAVRSHGFPHYIYIVLLTARDGSNHAVEGLSAGADDFMTKPFNPAELSMRLRVGQRVLSLETRDVTIFALAKLAESRDPETGAHLERVQNYSRVLAEYLLDRPKFRGVIDREYVRLIYLTSPLHDIGKVAIPDCVLLKPGRLTDREFDIMKTHTLHGAATLEAALKQYPEARFLKMARDIALTHHEQWDGSGYPNRIKADEIPLCGRIVALADVYDALVSKRVYKAAFSHDIARATLLDGSGTHFDPDVVDAFIKCEEAFTMINEHYRDDAEARAAA